MNNGVDRGTQRGRQLVVALGLTLVLVVLLRTAWVCDDARERLVTVVSMLLGRYDGYRDSYLLRRRAAE